MTNDTVQLLIAFGESVSKTFCAQDELLRAMSSAMLLDSRQRVELLRNMRMQLERMNDCCEAKTVGVHMPDCHTAKLLGMMSAQLFREGTVQEVCLKISNVTQDQLSDDERLISDLADKLQSANGRCQTCADQCGSPCDECLVDEKLLDEIEKREGKTARVACCSHCDERAAC